MTAPLKKKLQEDLNAARKGREKLRTLVLSTTLSDLKNLEIEMGGEADDSAVLSVLTSAVKRRKEASEQMRNAGRPELADREALEAEILSAYLPEGLSQDEVRHMVRELMGEGITDMGPLMGRLMPRLKGRFDGKEANRIVREELAG